LPDVDMPYTRSMVLSDCRRVDADVC